VEDNVDAQRGKGVFAASLRGLKRLNALGYGRAGTGLVLNLVYNPEGPRLPPPQPVLEAQYREHLDREHGIAFTSLYALANRPIERFARTLAARGQHQGYMTLLRAAHRDENLETVMCRTLLSVDWRGHVYDCDFNQMLGIPLGDRDRPTRLSELIGLEVAGRPIAVREHCYACTAGQGSSCGGALQQVPNP
jgi:radical SAM/Cys-rich protein